MNSAKLLKSYIKWYWKAKNLHGIHSPFLYDFIKDCLNTNDEHELFGQIESIREIYRRDTTRLIYQDPGAGNRRGTKPGQVHKQTQVKAIAKTSLQKPKYSRLLFRLIKHFTIKSALELGTSLGITTSYMSLANKDATIDTIEGVEVIAALALSTFEKLERTNIHLHKGTFDQILPHLLKQGKQYELVYIDGNHKGEALLKYFDLLIKHIPKHGVLVLDDIRWSTSMYEAWKKIEKDPRVQVTIDFFNMGMVFFNPALSKENFYIKF